MKGWMLLALAIILGLWFRKWSQTSANQGAPFTGISSQRGPFGTDGTPVAGAT